MVAQDSIPRYIQGLVREHILEVCLELRICNVLHTAVIEIVTGVEDELDIHV